MSVASKLAEVLKYDAEKSQVTFTQWDGKAYGVLSNLISQLDVDSDTAFDEVLTALEAIDREGADQIEDNVWEYAEPDIYTCDLLDWVSKHMSNIAWCDEAMATGLHGDSSSLIDILMAGQSMAKQHVWQSVIGLVREMEEEEEDYG
jgi:hypothetical protein